MIRYTDRNSFVHQSLQQTGQTNASIYYSTLDESNSERAVLKLVFCRIYEVLKVLQGFLKLFLVLQNCNQTHELVRW